MTPYCIFYHSLRWRSAVVNNLLWSIGILAFLVATTGDGVAASIVRRSTETDPGSSSQQQTAGRQNHSSGHAPSASRHSFGTVDDYRNRIQNMFRLLENRPDQGCPSTKVYRFYCPTPHPLNPETGWVCIKIDDLCNNIPDCPGAEDEDPTQCMYYLAIQHQAYQLRTIIVNQLQQKSQSSSHLLNDDNEFRK